VRITNDAYPALYQVADGSSVAGQRIYRRLVAAELAFVLAGAAFPPISAIAAVRPATYLARIPRYLPDSSSAAVRTDPRTMAARPRSTASAARSAPTCPTLAGRRSSRRYPSHRGSADARAG